MLACSDAISKAGGTQYSGTARVLGQLGETGCLRILLGELPGSQEATARISASLQVEPVAGDLILVAGRSIRELFVLAVLERGFTDTAPVRSIASRDGATVTLEETSASSSIKVFSKHKELLFEYDPAKEHVRLHPAPGDLEIDVPGNIRFRSGKTLVLSGQEVRVKAQSESETGIDQTNRRHASSLSLRPGHLNLEASRFGLRANRGRIRVDEMKYAGNRLDGVVKRSRLIVDRAERISRTVIERARNVYRTVEQLTQLRSGRVRTLVDSTYYMKSRKTYLKSEKSFNVDGERINLG